MVSFQERFGKENAEDWFNLGLLRQRGDGYGWSVDGHLFSAKDCFQNALEIDPNHSRARQKVDELTDST